MSKLVIIALLGAFQACAAVQDEDWFSKTPIVFWGKITTVRNAEVVAEITMPIKGCLTKARSITIKGVGRCGLAEGQDLVFGGKRAGKGKGSPAAIQAFCSGVGEPAALVKVAMASHMEKCGKALRCGDGSKPAVCKTAVVCGPKPKWSKKCQAASKCSVQRCGGCAATFQKGAAQVCSDLCPDGSQPSVCTNNPCDYARVSDLTCPEASSAVQCMVDPCGGCSARFLDRYGAEVCRQSRPSCQDRNVFNYGKGKARKGFGLVNGVCKLLTGSKMPSPTATFPSLGTCEGACRCQDNFLVDFGSCAGGLGWTVVRGQCQRVTGCLDQKLKTSFFATKMACERVCSGLPVPVSNQQSVAPPVPAAPPVAPVSPVAPVAPVAPARAEGVRCPASKPFQSCQNPCLSQPPPQCAESRGTTLVCVPDYCGACEARWLHNGRPFQCPPARACSPGEAGCCPSGLQQRECSAYQCDPDLCTDAATCAIDPCQECETKFFDAGGKEIPGFMCRRGMDPAAFKACRPGQACCPSGFQPLECNADQQLMDEACETITCGNRPVGGCRANPCDHCALQVLGPQGNAYKSAQCQRSPPELCQSVQCPSMGQPKCGPPPAACDGLQLQCIIDKCACIWRWYSADLRQPSAACTAALQVCVAQAECPTAFACEPPPPEMLAAVAPAALAQLVCKQEPCSCRPLLLQPEYGVRASCEVGLDPGCCAADGLAAVQCPTAEAAWTCSKVQCEGVQVAECLADGCNHCSTRVVDVDGKEIDHQQCKVRLDQEISQMCSRVQCPADVVTVACPPRPPCYPADWQLECIIDPCSCRAIWIDQDIRKKPECAGSIHPQCVPAEECPLSFECEELDPGLLASLDPAIVESLVCVQEPCSCRTVPIVPPPGYRFPCKAGQGQPCCPGGVGALACPAQIKKSCAMIECEAGISLGECEPDSCSSCELVLKDIFGQVIPPTKCRIPFDHSLFCAHSPCPAASSLLRCPDRPSACGKDWNLRCIVDPCVCSRKIWINEDVRIPSPQCEAAVVPACLDQADCPADFACPPGVPEGIPCVQEQCTCRPIPDPFYMMQMMQGGQNGPNMMQGGPMGGQMGGPGERGR